MTKISIIGAGAWGTALANIISAKGKKTFLYARNASLTDEINATHENKRYLTSIPLNKNLIATSEISEALQNEIIMLVTPAQAMRKTLTQIKPLIRPEHILILCAKGLEKGSTLRMSEIASEILPNTSLAILSGPNFAHDVAQGKPAATTLATKRQNNSQYIQEVIATSTFRPYLSTDIIGVEIAGALKNVIAIACGIAHGMNMGESARASLITRGLAEISRLGIKMGAQNDTFLGLSGVGDMLLTCSSTQSRNFSLGTALGQGQSLKEILNARSSVTEGVHTAESANALAQKYDVDLPICQAIHKCINEEYPLDAMLQEMLNRPLKHE